MGIASFKRPARELPTGSGHGRLPARPPGGRVGLADGFAEPILRQGFDLLLVQLVFLDDFEDEVALLGAAFPGVIAVRAVVAVSIAISITMTVALTNGDGVITRLDLGVGGEEQTGSPGAGSLLEQ